MAGGSISRLALGTAPFLLPLFFQLGFGLSAAAVGSLAAVAVCRQSRHEDDHDAARAPFRVPPRLLLYNGLLTAASLLVCATFVQSTPFVAIAVILFLCGASRSLQFTSFSSISFADVPPPQMSGANTLSSMLMQLSMGTSIALGALVLRASSYVHGRFGATPIVSDFHLAFVIVTAIAVLSIIDVWRTTRRRRARRQPSLDPTARGLGARSLRGETRDS